MPSHREHAGGSLTTPMQLTDTPRQCEQALLALLVFLLGLLLLLRRTLALVLLHQLRRAILDEVAGLVEARPLR